MDRNWRTRTDPFAEVWSDILERCFGSTPDWRPRQSLPTCNGVSRVASPRPTADPATAVSAVAGPGGLCQGGFLRPGSLPRTAVCQRLHPLHRPGRDHQRPAVRPHDLPLRPDLLQLGVRHVCFSESLESLSEGLQNALWELGGVPRIPPHRPADSGHPAGRRRARRRSSSVTRLCCNTTACRPRPSRPARATRTVMPSKVTTSSSGLWTRR